MSYKYIGIEEKIINQEKLTRKSSRKIIHRLFSMLYIVKKMKVYPAHTSKHNLNCENQIILLIFQTKKDGIILQE